MHMPSRLQVPAQRATAKKMETGNETACYPFCSGWVIQEKRKGHQRWPFAQLNSGRSQILRRNRGADRSCGGAGPVERAALVDRRQGEGVARDLGVRRGATERSRDDALGDVNL